MHGEKPPILLRNKKIDIGRLIMQTIYHNGTILKMDGKEDSTSAVLVEDAKITDMGTLQELQKKAARDVKIYDLKGKTLMPAFIDAHSHITMAAQMSMFADLTDCVSFEQIVSKLKLYVKEKKAQQLEIIVGFGYDHNVLNERRHPDKEVLNKVSENIPVFIIHVSGHMGVVNSVGLELLNITEKTENPAGGSIGRMENSKVPNGYMEEAALMLLQYGFADMMKADMISAIKEIQMTYLQNGITTVQDGAASGETIKLLRTFAEKGILSLDVVSYPVMTDISISSISNEDLIYKNHFRIGGYKIILDGSPQGRSAWLSIPYENGNGERGYPWMSDEKVLHYCKKAVTEKRQILAHCNGDAASEQFLDCYETALEESENKKCDLRPVMIHCQTERKDQIERMSKMNMIASFFVGHVYYWGDVHLENLGKERGMAISSVATALKNNVCVTFHQDTPVTKPNMLHSVYCAVERRTRKGVLLDQNECISVYEALKAVTINAAYQYHEENSKGSIAVGKNADLIILDKNPMEVNSSELQEIKVEATIKDGNMLYIRKDI